MERKSGSSSRSPSLSRRPSLKDKSKPTLISKAKKKGTPGAKKERWLLTRKTWRYMTDAVGNLLPEYRAGSRRGSTLLHNTQTASASPPIQEKGGTSSGCSRSPPLSQQSPGATAQTSTSRCTTSPPGPPHLHWHQQLLSHQLHQQQGPTPTTATTTGAAGAKSKSKPTSPTASTFPWGSFASHRPGVTPTGPGPGTSTSSRHHLPHPVTDPEDLPQVERHFQQVCTKETKFLLWTRTKPKALSGPALRDLKLQKQREEEEKRSKHRDSVFSPEDLSPEEYEDGEEYDEYEHEDEQITVRERRKSSTLSILGHLGHLGHPGSSFFRPLSSHSDTTYAMVHSGTDAQRIVRNTGIQTDPFPEELLIRLRLQAVHDERQRQIALHHQQHQLLSCGGQGQGPGPGPGQGEMESVSASGWGQSTGGMSSSGGSASTNSGSGGRETVIAISQAGGKEGTTGGSGCEAEATERPEERKSEESGYSSSISDTVLKYLRIMRKNSKADAKETIDKFKTVNYDRSLRYIKSKNVTLEEALEHEKNKALGLLAGPPESIPTPITPKPHNPQPTATTTTTPGANSTSGPDPPSTLPPTLTSGPTPSTTSTSRVTRPSKGKKQKGSLVQEGVQTTTTTQSATSSLPSPPPGATGEGVVSASTGEPLDPIPLDLPPQPLPPGPPQPLVPPPAPPKEMGVQAGESLIRYLKNLDPLRKLSDLSSSSTSYFPDSESPFDLCSTTSPRYSIATTLSEDLFLHHTHPLSSTSSGLPTTTRSSFDLFSTPDSSEFELSSLQEALLSNYHLLLHRDTGDTPKDYKAPPTSTSSRHQHQHQLGLNVKISGSSTPSTPSSSSSSIMKSFFSSPFKSGGKKPSSTTSLLGPTTTTPSTRTVLPPTTSSSPNLLALLHSPTLSRGGRPEEPQVTPSSSLKQHQRSGFSLKGSLVPHKGRMSLPLGDSPGSGAGVGWGQGGHSSPTTTTATLNPSASSTVMQKSKSSSSVLPLYSADKEQRAPGQGSAGANPGSSRLISKARIFKSRSKSTTRGSSSSASCAWAPQGKCKWKSPWGKTMVLEGTTVLALSEVERQTLQEVALEKIKSLALGVEVKVPKEKSGAPQTKPKRRPYLLKKKALSTGFFESGSNKEGKGESGGSGIVFGISLAQCVANDRQRQQKEKVVVAPEWEGGYKRSQNGSRNSVVSTSDVQREDKGSSESLFWGKRGSVAAVDLAPPGDILGDTLEPPPVSVPAIVTACVKHLESFGLHTTGIFRVSTSLKRIRQLREEIDAGREINFGSEHSPHDVAALLKEFLRDLPDPLLSQELYQGFLRTQRIRNRKQQLEAVQHLVQLLPVSNRDTLASLLKFFAKVVANSVETRTTSGEVLPGNKMEGYSLATLIAPNILPCIPSEGTSLDLTKERRESIDVVNYMISNYRALFDVSPELLHDVYLHLMDTQPDAVERILKIKSGFGDDPTDEAEVETSSVFEGSECGDLAEVEETQPRVFRRREDILHEGAARGGSGSERTRERARSKRESSREGHVDTEKGQSGAESDSSSTKSTSRWFRRTRGDKARTSSDSGSEKVKGRAGAESSQLQESKRANSLDSVNVVKELGGAVGVGAREKSSSDQSLKVPEQLGSRRQSSPVLESAGVITASLKIPVPVPLSIDDTDIPFIEEDNQFQPSELVHHHLHRTQPTTRARGRSASTDSSGLIKTPFSSHTSTPISSPGRQPSSEVSSPMGFSPPGSPPYDPRTFPYEEMTARILIGASDLPSSTTPTLSTVTTSVESKSAGSTPTVRPRRADSSKVVTSLYLQPAANGGGGGAASAPVLPQPSPTASTASTAYLPLTSEPKGLGKETKGANIGGLIKSKTADFEKLAKSTSPSATTTTTSTYSIAPKMRLRSQENIVLKQQFLLRQQQTADDKRATREARDAKESPPLRTNSRESKSTEERPSPSEQPSTSTKESRPRPLTRRRHIVGSASSSAITSSDQPSTSSQPTQSGQSSQSQPVSVTVRSSMIASPPATSRWKRSEIIASRHEPQPPKDDPETFV